MPRPMRSTPGRREFGFVLALAFAGLALVLAVALWPWPAGVSSHAAAVLPVVASTR